MLRRPVTDRGGLDPLHSVCDLMPVTVLREANGDPIAWSIEGVCG